ncbi:sugar phosphate isomerase/epimerase family protein [Arthrobacter sp. NA-172]|uniref:sugar phosphate isomerase/epimerase family protein n=1 Tax=Arthrobacter sp. NA-172 TaxID=3367524 RepID=UPI0037546208
MISVQLWSLRKEIFDLGWDPVIDTLAGAGFKHVEPFGISETAPLLLPALKRNEITTPTGHGEIVGDQLAATLDAAVGSGVELLMQPMFPAERWRDRDGVRRIAEDLNRAAEAARPYGMRIAFHNHDDEVRTMIDGRPALAALMDEVAPNVGVEFDPNWATIGGADVLELMSTLGDRIFAVHLKDGPLRGTNSDQLALGDGELGWDSFLDALDPALPRVIGLDMFAGDSLAAVLRSKRWLDERGA